MRKWFCFMGGIKGAGVIIRKLPINSSILLTYSWNILKFGLMELEMCFAVKMCCTCSGFGSFVMKSLGTNLCSN